MVFPTRESEKAIAGYSITLVDALKEKGVDTISETYTMGSAKSFLRLMPKLLKYDIVHIQHEYMIVGNYSLPFFIAFPFLKFFKKGKLVVTMHTVPSQKTEFVGGKFKNFVRKLIYKLENKIIKWSCDKVIVHTGLFTDILDKEYGFNKKEIDIIPQGVITNIPKFSKAQCKKELKLSGPVYLVIGNFVYDHGQDIVLRQADKIGKTILVKYNPKPLNNTNSKKASDFFEKTKKMVSEKKLDKFVRWDIFDISDTSDLWWKYFTAADLVLLPYRGGIGSGILYHSIAAETPMVASNGPYFKEHEKLYGCLKTVDKEEDYPKVIKETMKKKNLLKLEKDCKDFKKRFSWLELADKYRKIYSSLTQSK